MPPLGVRNLFDRSRVIWAPESKRSPLIVLENCLDHSLTGDLGARESTRTLIKVADNITWLTHWGLTKDKPYSNWFKAHRLGQVGPKGRETGRQTGRQTGMKTSRVRQTGLD